MGPRERRPLGVLVLPCLFACLYNADDRCGEHQKYVHSSCVCAEGYAQKGSLCEEVPAPADAGSMSVEEGGMEPSEGGRAPYTGQKAPCTDDTSCAGFDAKHCNPIVHTCLVRDCTETSCDPGYMCIDLGMYIPGEPKVCLDPADFPR